MRTGRAIVVGLASFGLLLGIFFDAAVAAETEQGLTKAEILQPMAAPATDRTGSDWPELSVTTVLTAELETREPLAATEVFVVHHSAAAPVSEVVRVFSRHGESQRYSEVMRFESTPAETRFLPPSAFVYTPVQKHDEPLIVVQVQERGFGTGRELVQHLRVFDNVAWHALEMPDIANMFASTLSERESFGGHTTPETNFTSNGLEAWLDIYTDDDPNCCPSGGRIEVKLALRKQSVIDSEGQARSSEYWLCVKSFERK